MNNQLRSLVMLGIATAALSACSADSTAPLQAAANRSAADSSASASTGSAGHYGQQSTGRIRLAARLTPPVGGTFNRASGKASWDSRNNNTKRELEMEVEDVRAGTQVEFFVNGVKYGSTVTVNALGRASINLSTELRQVVPPAAAGLVAQIRTSAGAVVVTGTFPTA